MLGRHQVVADAGSRLRLPGLRALTVILAASLLAAPASVGARGPKLDWHDGAWIGGASPKSTSLTVEPTAQALVVPRKVSRIPGLEPGSRGPLVIPGVRLQRRQVATVWVREVLWEGGLPTIDRTAVHRGSRLRVGGDPGKWGRIVDALERRERVVLLLNNGPRGTFSFSHALTMRPGLPAFIGRLSGPTLLLRSLLGWQPWPRYRLSPERFIVDWNEELSAQHSSGRREPGPIVRAFQRFVDEEYYRSGPGSWFRFARVLYPRTLQ